MSRKISISAISVSLAVIALTGSVFIPYVNIVLAVIASLFVIMPLLSNVGLKYTILCYLVTATLGMLLFSGFLSQMLFAIIFIMPYTIIKTAFADKITDRVKRITIRYICANILMAIFIGLAYLLTYEFFSYYVQYWWIVIIAVQLLVIPYDFVLNQAIITFKQIVTRIRGSR